MGPKMGSKMGSFLGSKMGPVLGTIRHIWSMYGVFDLFWVMYLSIEIKYGRVSKKGGENRVKKGVQKWVKNGVKNGVNFGAKKWAKNE